MITKSAFDFFVDRDKKTITVKREFPAELPLVWDAYTKSNILDQWWAPKPWKAKTKKMEFREGGQWIYAMIGPEGQEHWSVVDYISIQPRKKFFKYLSGCWFYQSPLFIFPAIGWWL